MKRKDPTTLPKQKITQPYTRKQALGVLHRLYQEKYVPLAPFDEQISREVHNAFSVLARAIHGEPTGPRYTFRLCDVCHERYYQHWVEVPSASFPDITYTRSCCTACKDQLLAEGKVRAIDWKPMASPNSEGQPGHSSDTPQDEENTPQ